MYNFNIFERVQIATLCEFHMLIPFKQIHSILMYILKRKKIKIHSPLVWLAQWHLKVLTTLFSIAFTAIVQCLLILKGEHCNFLNNWPFSHCFVMVDPASKNFVADQILGRPFKVWIYQVLSCCSHSFENRSYFKEILAQ